MENPSKEVADAYNKLQKALGSDQRINVCIGCGTTKNVTKCDETMCCECWGRENNTPDENYV